MPMPQMDPLAMQALMRLMMRGGMQGAGGGGGIAMSPTASPIFPMGDSGRGPPPDPTMGPKKDMPLPWVPPLDVYRGEGNELPPMDLSPEPDADDTRAGGGSQELPPQAARGGPPIGGGMDPLQVAVMMRMKRRMGGGGR